mgnify:FL=1
MPALVNNSVGSSGGGINDELGMTKWPFSRKNSRKPDLISFELFNVMVVVDIDVKSQILGAEVRGVNATVVGSKST